VKEIYEEVTNQSKMMCEAQKEEIFNNTLKENKKLNQEIERLNNIINEFEEWLNKKYDEIDKKRLGSNLQEELQICSYLAIYETILKKLQELKGVDKE